MAYDIKRRVEFKCDTVSALISVLKAQNPNAKILCDGDDYFYLHVEADMSVVSIDSSSLDDEYEDPEWQQYLDYLTDWASNHAGPEYVGMSPASYQEWLKNEAQEEEPTE